MTCNSLLDPFFLFRLDGIFLEIHRLLAWMISNYPRVRKGKEG